jgi:hypothetical protein
MTTYLMPLNLVGVAAFLLVASLPLLFGACFGTRRASLRGAFATAWLACVLSGFMLGICVTLVLLLPFKLSHGVSPRHLFPGLLWDMATVSFIIGSISTLSGVAAGAVAAVWRYTLNKSATGH